MIYLDGTDDSWLIYADWLEEQGNYEMAGLIRAEMEEDAHNWEYQYQYIYAGGVGVGGVGGVGGSVGGVGVGVGVGD